LYLVQQVKDTGKYSSEVMLDAANGVGEEKVKQFAKYIGEALTIKTVNDGSGKLNYRVGKSYI